MTDNMPDMLVPAAIREFLLGCADREFDPRYLQGESCAIRVLVEEQDLLHEDPVGSAFVSLKIGDLAENVPEDLAALAVISTSIRKIIEDCPLENKSNLNYYSRGAAKTFVQTALELWPDLLHDRDEP